MKLFRNFLFILFALCFSSSLLFALSVKQLTLRQLVSMSDRIFRGTVCEPSKMEDDIYESQQLVEYTTFCVDECIKGSCGSKEVIKQIVHKSIPLPKYEVSKTYLMFLPADSEETGLVAPVGIWQGQFPMEIKNGKWLLPTLAKNKLLLNDLRSEDESSALGVSALKFANVPNDYQLFKTVVTNLVKENE